MRPSGVRGSVAIGVLFASLLGAAACSGSDGLVDPASCDSPVVLHAAVRTDSTNVLRAFVSAAVQRADSVVIRFGTNGTRDSVTPSRVPIGDSVSAPVLGLEPARIYAAQLVAYGACGTATSDVLSFTTGALPADLPTFGTVGSSPSPGYVVFGSGKYGLAIDNSGRVVWYHGFPDGLGLSFQAQPNGRYTTRPPAPANTVASWVEVTPEGTVARTMGCARDLPPRMHDMLAQPDGSYWLLCDEVRTLDLSAQGASSAARVLGTNVQHRSAAGDLLFEWSPFDHLDVTLALLDAPDRGATPINWTHGNALDVDVDGNLLVSFRNLNQLVKVDTRTGAVVWIMGGQGNQFTVQSLTAPAFVHQHGARMLGGGQILLLDNLGESDGSRAERYEVDETQHVVRLSSAFRAVPALVAQVGGSVQALRDGHTLVSFGSGNGVAEYDANGGVVWRLTGNPGYVFRAQRVKSLYRPGEGDTR